MSEAAQVEAVANAVSPLRPGYTAFPLPIRAPAGRLANAKSETCLDYLVEAVTAHLHGLRAPSLLPQIA